jgi:hypothetical protein
MNTSSLTHVLEGSSEKTAQALKHKSTLELVSPKATFSNMIARSTIFIELFMSLNLAPS